MPSNIRVYFDVKIGTSCGGRIVFELFNDVCPMAVENFRCLCTGERGISQTSGRLLSYKNCQFFKCIPGVFVQSGDFEFNNGEGGESIYGRTFRDESLVRRHGQAGVLSMASRGARHTNNSQFYVTLKKAPQLDGKNVAIGQLVQGMDILRAIEKCPIDSNNRPRVPIYIADCGELEKVRLPKRSDPKVQMKESVDLLMNTVTGAPDNDDVVSIRRPTEAQLGAERILEALKEAKKKNDAEREQENRKLLKGIVNSKEAAEDVAETSETERDENLADQARNRDLTKTLGETRDNEDLREDLDGSQIVDLDRGQIAERGLNDSNDNRQKKLYDLKLKLNQSRNLNSKEVKKEIRIN